MGMKTMKVIGLVLLLNLSFAQGADLPGGLLRTAEGLPADTYELLVSPSYLISSRGAYLTSELRYQSFDVLGVGLGFGAGEVGFNFGVNGIWHLFPHLNLEPEVALLGGLYFNRVFDANYFVVKVAPALSWSFFFSWGEFIPYGGFQMSPSFRLAEPANLFSIKGGVGMQLVFQKMDGLRLMTEFGWGLLNSTNEWSFAISYPFVAL